MTNKNSEEEAGLGSHEKPEEVLFISASKVPALPRPIMELTE
jgi:hypothetical protein